MDISRFDVMAPSRIKWFCLAIIMPDKVGIIWVLLYMARILYFGILSRPQGPALVMPLSPNPMTNLMTHVINNARMCHLVIRNGTVISQILMFPPLGRAFPLTHLPSRSIAHLSGIWRTPVTAIGVPPNVNYGKQAK